MVDAFLDALKEALARGDGIELRGFGTFKVKHRKARMGRNPRTGQTVEVPARDVPVFKPSRHLRPSPHRVISSGHDDAEHPGNRAALPIRGLYLYVYGAHHGCGDGDCVSRNRHRNQGGIQRLGVVSQALPVFPGEEGGQVNRTRCLKPDGRCVRRVGTELRAGFRRPQGQSARDTQPDQGLCGRRHGPIRPRRLIHCFLLPPRWLFPPRGRPQCARPQRLLPMIRTTRPCLSTTRSGIGMMSSANSMVGPSSLSAAASRWSVKASAPAGLTL